MNTSLHNHLSGGQNTAMHERIVRACKQFGANTYQWVTTAREARDKLHETQQLVADKERALTASATILREGLARLTNRVGSANTASLIEDWRLFLLKEKGIYSVLNMCEGEGSTLRAHVWYPAFEEDFIRRVLIQESRTTYCSAMLITDRIHI